MRLKEKIEYWIDIAEYDMETARSMLSTGRYLYTVLVNKEKANELFSKSEGVFLWLKSQIKS